MILFDYYCNTCDCYFEALAEHEDRTLDCSVCGAEKAAERVLSAPHVAKYTDPASKADALRKRSYDHSMKEARQNAEQIASKLGGVAKAQSPWNIRSQKGK